MRREAWYNRATATHGKTAERDAVCSFNRLTEAQRAGEINKGRGRVGEKETAKFSVLFCFTQTCIWS